MFNMNKLVEKLARENGIQLRMGEVECLDNNIQTFAQAVAKHTVDQITVDMVHSLDMSQQDKFKVLQMLHNYIDKVKADFK